jgi:hypothetical protein
MLLVCIPMTVIFLAMVWLACLLALDPGSFYQGIARGVSFRRGLRSNRPNLSAVHGIILRLTARPLKTSLPRSFQRRTHARGQLPHWTIRAQRTGKTAKETAPAIDPLYCSRVRHSHNSRAKIPRALQMRPRRAPHRAEMSAGR